MIGIKSDYTGVAVFKKQSPASILERPVFVKYDSDFSNISGSQTTENQGGASFWKTTSASATKEGSIRVEGFAPISFNSLDPNVATVDSNGLVSRVSDGSAIVEIDSGLGFKLGLFVDVLEVQGQTLYEYISMLSGSFSSELRANSESLFIGSPSGGNDQIFSTLDHTVSSYVRNSNHGLSSYDLTGVCALNVTKNNNQVAHPATPIHCIGTAHYPPSIGDVLRWVDGSNQIIERTVVARIKQPERSINLGWGAASGAYDLAAFRLDLPLPPSIKPFKTLPYELINYCSPLILRGSPGDWLSDSPKGAILSQGSSVVEMRFVSGGALFRDDSRYDRANTLNEIRIYPELPWSQSALNIGDSSSWAGIFNATEAIMTHAVTFSNGMGYSISENQFWINQSFINLDTEASAYPYTVDGQWPDDGSGHYILNTIDLSGYTQT